MFSILANMTMLGLEANEVILMRFLTLAKSGPDLPQEMALMVSEKLAAGSKAAGDLMTGRPLDLVVSDYRDVVQANIKRLRALS